MNREEMLRRLEQDLMGPLDPSEILSSRPSDVYLTGILWPWESRMDAAEDEGLATGTGDDDGSAAGEEEEVSLAGLTRPCTAGLSFAVGCEDGIPSISILVRCATYEPGEEEAATSEAGRPGRRSLRWVRRQHEILIGPVLCNESARSIDLAKPATDPLVSARTEHGIPEGLQLHIRSASWSKARLVTVTAMNRSVPDEALGRTGVEALTLFQVSIEIAAHADSWLAARPSRKAMVDDDDRNSALLYHSAREFAAGHTCSAAWTVEPGAEHASLVSTTWIPRAVVPAVRAQGHHLFDSLSSGGSQVLSAKWLSSARGELGKGLGSVVDIYRRWLDEKDKELADVPSELRREGEQNLQYCRDIVAARMAEGAAFIGSDRNAALAFRLANLAMLTQHVWDPEKSGSGGLVWRPFQLGFFLLCAASVAQRGHTDRQVMDLLWFPTGGGKTEAYLALTAFLAFYRRLTAGRPDDGAGVTVLMRYTLRLLTTQQFARAAAMILACEALRRRSMPGVPPDVDLGTEPFSIGLWVGGEATPNRFQDAAASLAGDPNQPSPRQLVTCPACRKTLVWSADQDQKAIRVRCANGACVLRGDVPLPVWTVDEDVYRQKPTLLIGTVDKFAQVVRRQEVNALFAVSHGLPPDLIIQDELHLISGPLGTVTGLYEAIVDRLFTRDGIRPKVIGSTATIRRAAEQVSALFNRSTCQFPPAALDAGDSGFAVVDRETPGRLYAGVTTAGRSAKFTLQAVAGTLLQSGLAAFPKQSEADPYWTLVAYFNSLRELGGALVLMQDDVADAVAQYADRRNEAVRPVKAVEELTSRRTQAEVREMLDTLAIRVGDEGALDAVLASNMLSVGVDVPRLGLMLVNGQPKGIAEYIQATSRVGRRHPGLVISVLNNAKARDRSHYETFTTWHDTVYRDVEATSVTPFASRARDRALHAVLVALVRHLVPGMLDKPDLDVADPDALEAVVEDIVARASAVDPSETDVETELRDRLDRWRMRAPGSWWNEFRIRESLLQSAERAATMRALGRAPGEAWPTLNNMRNVESSVPFRLAERLRSSNTGNKGGNDAQ